MTNSVDDVHYINTGYLNAKKRLEDAAIGE
jgi:hypothetical protein